MKLFAIYVGGGHPRANIEIHDIRFVAGEDLEATFPVLKQEWWGTPGSLHVDAYADLTRLPGWQVNVQDTPPPDGGARLFFVNVGYYVAGRFGELHDYQFRVCDSEKTAWCEAKAALGRQEGMHKDNLIGVDDIIDVSAEIEAGGRYLALTPDTGTAGGPEPVSCYIRLA